MQPPTLTRVRIRSTADARTVLHAVALGILPMVKRRLDTDERRAVCSGCVFVWEERGPNSEVTGLGIERWTDGIRWGPSRVRDEFLFYHEKDPEPEADFDTLDTASHSSGSPRHTPFDYRDPGRRQADRLVKQTYSSLVDTTHGRRKWHLTAYFTQETVNVLHSIEELPQLRGLQVPAGLYRSSRTAKGRTRDDHVAPVQHPVAPMPGAPYESYSYPPPPPPYAHNQHSQRPHHYAPYPPPNYPQGYQHPQRRSPVSASHAHASTNMPNNSPSHHRGILAHAPPPPSPIHMPIVKAPQPAPFELAPVPEYLHADPPSYPGIGTMVIPKPKFGSLFKDPNQPQLAPLEFLEGLDFRPRHPIDDAALRAFVFKP